MIYLIRYGGMVTFTRCQTLKIAKIEACRYLHLLPIIEVYNNPANEITYTDNEIKDMNIPVETCFHNLAIISIKKTYPAHAQKIMSSLWGMGQLMFSKCIIVVDEDVDVQNLSEVAWRVSNNIDARRDIVFTEGPVDALDHAAPRFGIGSKMGIDATRKWKEEGYQREWPPDIEMDENTKRRIDEIWEKLMA